MDTNSVISLIGNTPLIRLKQASELTGCNIYGKAEYFNPGESVKDRAALFIVQDAFKRKLISRGGNIVEGTAGNTGIGLAIVCKEYDLKLKIVIPKTQSIEKKETLKKALLSYVLLQQAESSHINKLVFYYQDILSFSDMEEDEKWTEVSNFLLNKIILLSRIDDDSLSLAIERKVFARVKMLWSYMRSSLPEEFLSPVFLRSKSFAEFLSHINISFEKIGSDILPFRYYKERDKLFSGELR